MSEYFLRFDPQEIWVNERIQIDKDLETKKDLTFQQFNELVKGFEHEYSYDEYRNYHRQKTEI